MVRITLDNGVFTVIQVCLKLLLKHLFVSDYVTPPSIEHLDVTSVVTLLLTLACLLNRTYTHPSHLFVERSAVLDVD